MIKKEAQCIFCKIAKKEIPCQKVYENKNFLAFLDIRPVDHGHMLIIPKKHIAWMQEADDKTIADIFKLTKKMILAMKKSLKCDYVQISVVGNEVPHFHIHLIPRYLKDTFRPMPRKKTNKLESEKAFKKILKAI